MCHLQCFQTLFSEHSSSETEACSEGVSIGGSNIQRLGFHGFRITATRMGTAGKGGAGEKNFRSLGDGYIWPLSSQRYLSCPLLSNCAVFERIQDQSIHALELDMLENMSHVSALQKGALTWVARGLKIQESQLALAQDICWLGIHATELQHLTIAWQTDQLSMEISAFLAKAKIHLSPNYEDGIQWGDSDSDCDYASEECTLQDAKEDLLDRVDGNRPDHAYIPLPSNIGCSKYVDLGLQNLVDMELKLQVGQANDTLQEIHIGVAEKAILFCHGLHRVSGYSKKTQAWGRVHAADYILERHGMINWNCQGAMVRLGVNEPTLACYQVLRKEHLNATTSATNLNARGLRYEVLPWYFNLDMEHDTESSTWMLECKFILSTYSIRCWHDVHTSSSSSLAAGKGHKRSVDWRGRITT